MNLSYKQTVELIRLVDNELSFLEDNKNRWKMGYRTGDWKGLSENEVNKTIQSHEEHIKMLEDIINQLKQ